MTLSLNLGKVAQQLGHLLLMRKAVLKSTQIVALDILYLNTLHLCHLPSFTSDQDVNWIPLMQEETSPKMQVKDPVNS